LGFFDEAERWLSACLRRRPDDVPVWRARLDWAMAADRAAEAKEAMKHIPADQSSPAQVSKLEAWLAERGGDRAALRPALERLVAADPTDVAALERLMELTTTEGQQAPPAELQRRKEEVSRLIARYRQLLGRNQPMRDAEEMARLAERLRRSFEARAFLTIATLTDPGRDDLKRDLERLIRSANTRAEPGKTLADVVAKDLGSVPTSAPAQPAPLVFRVQELPFEYDRGETGSAWPVETTGGGVGLLDYDGDGRLDLFFAQGGPLLPHDRSEKATDVLLRNLGGGRFQDVSAQVGLTSKGYGQGVAVADFDGDGYPDVYVTRYGRNTLWRNDHGRFSDVTNQSGVEVGLWSLGAAFADYDGDGDLDLFVANYLSFDPALAPYARDPNTGAAEYGMPADFQGQPDRLFRNEGKGRFTDVTARAGVAGNGRGMGVLASDFDGDGRVDVLVANDAMNNALWRNRGDGTFEDVATIWGIAVNGQGLAEANMGIGYGDTNGDQLQDVVISHFFGEHHTLWRKETVPGGRVLFEDWTNEAGLGIDSLPLTGWGIALADFDQDGTLDMVVTNGHIRREPTQRYPYANPPILWRGTGGRFANVTATGGPYFRSLHEGRGMACGDLDNDGDLDLVIVHHHARSVVLWNETPSCGNWLMVKLQGRPPNRDAIGARLIARAGSSTQVRTRDGGGSYVSANDPRLHLGLGKAPAVETLELRWPSGRVETRSNPPLNTVIEWAEME
jgi:hypothetical protein